MEVRQLAVTLRASRGILLQFDEPAIGVGLPPTPSALTLAGRAAAVMTP